ncbi:MAG TPA: FKBP-type peptidyl-prolyl cis-trans isomerase [Bacteroidia bacterium]|nr:FKBP-type peptidyl-prolyl cis-trans isomerase [Bacteroidia bacterium]
MKKHTGLALLAALILFSCKEQRIPGFRPLDNGSYFKLISLGENDRKPRGGDYLELVMRNTFADSVLYDSHLESPTGTMLAPYNEKDGYSRLREGDSAVFLIPAYDLMEYANDSMMHMQVKLVRILDEKQYKAESEKRARMDEFGEQKILQYYMKSIHEKYKALPHGLFMLEERSGSGKTVERGDRVLLNYKGEFLNGKKFDATSEPVEFVLGEEGQLIEGMTQGLMRMKEGGKAKFIIPSQLAYGAEGSSTGIIKPFTSIIYQIEILKVY